MYMYSNLPSNLLRGSVFIASFAFIPLYSMHGLGALVYYCHDQVRETEKKND